MPVIEMCLLSRYGHGYPLNAYPQHKHLLQSVRTLVYRGWMWGVGKERCEVVGGRWDVCCVPLRWDVCFVPLRWDVCCVPVSLTWRGGGESDVESLWREQGRSIILT